MDILKNRKAQFALLLLALGITLGTGFFVNNVSGSAMVRADFYTYSIDQANDLESMRMYYDEFIASKTFSALEDVGYGSGSVCGSRLNAATYADLNTALVNRVKEDVKTVTYGENPLPEIKEAVFSNIYETYYCVWNPQVWKQVGLNTYLHAATECDSCGEFCSGGTIAGVDSGGAIEDQTDPVRCLCPYNDKLQVNYELKDPITVTKSGVNMSYSYTEPSIIELTTDPDVSGSYKRNVLDAGGKETIFDFGTNLPAGDELFYAIQPEKETYYCCWDNTWKSTKCWAHLETDCTDPNLDTPVSCAEKCTSVGKTGVFVGDINSAEGADRRRCECSTNAKQSITVNTYFRTEENEDWTTGDTIDINYRESGESEVPIFGDRIDVTVPYRYLKVETSENIKESQIYVENFCQPYTYLEPYWVSRDGTYDSAKFQTTKTLANPELLVIFTVNTVDQESTITVEAGETENGLIEIGKQEKIHSVDDTVEYKSHIFKLKPTGNINYIKVTSTQASGLHHVRIAVIG
jgi:hypothetical protein